MSIYGKISAWLTVVGLIPVLYLLSMAGNIHNEWSEKMRSAETAAKKAESDIKSTEATLVKTSHDLAIAQLGWDKSWNIGSDANTSVTIRPDGRLDVEGVGQGNGLVPISGPDGQAASPPAVHAFVVKPEGGTRYVGEFFADIAENQIGPNNVTLIPNWQVTQEEVDSWAANPNAGWRFRTLMPAALRMNIDELNERIVRLNELYLDTDSNVAQQEQLLNQAMAQLNLRKGELLGNKDVQPIAGRPELTDGLLNTIKSEEDRRNSLLIEIDELRRDIKKSAEERDEILGRLRAVMGLLPSADGNAHLTQGNNPTTN